MINDIIVDKLIRESTNTILVFDPDELLGGEETLDSIYRLGFEIIEYEDPEVFRYYYETNIRSVLDRGGELDKKLIIKYTSNHTIPYDIQQKCVSIEFSLREIFPKLSYDVVKELYTEAFDKVYTAYKDYHGSILGDRGTKEFILNKAYGIILETIDNFQELIRVFIPFYYRGDELPHLIADYAIEILEQKKQFRNHPIREIVGSRISFFRFIQEQWENYIEYTINKDTTTLVDFDDPAIRPFMDNLFQENYLRPIKRLSIEEYPSWMQAGVIYDITENIKRRFKEGLGRIKDLIQKISSYKDWYQVAQIWAEIVVLMHDSERNYSLDHKRYTEAKEEINRIFKDWLFDYYGRLSSLSHAQEPVIAHKIPWHISHEMDRKQTIKSALIVMDGMSLDNWYVMKESLDQVNDYIYKESQCFAWIPTITSVSRQAIFSGEIPVNFQDSLLSTSHDERQWNKFWKNKGYSDYSIAYTRGIKDFNESGLEQVINNDRIKILGLVVNMIDDIIHGQQLSIEGVHQDIRLWTKKNYFRDFIKCLLSKGYDVFITSDHGNTGAIGQGALREGLAVERPGERVRVYNPNINYANVLSGYKAFEWSGIGLPRDYSYILCEGDYAFVTKDKKIVSHGGINLEEVIVPFIHIRKED